MKLFNKNEIIFAVILIVIYVVGSSAAKQISEAAGIELLAETIFTAAMTAAVFIFIRRNGLSDYLGLKKADVPALKMLFYIPLALLGACGAFFGLGMEYSPLACTLHTVMMICVGFLEEIIFRGFLFRGIAKQNLTRAIVISSLTFGIGHIVNLFNGSNLAENIAQVVFAVAAGFLLVFIFLRTLSIIPCIVFHAFNNSMSAFTNMSILTDKFGEENAVLILACIMSVIAAAYLLYVIRLPKRELPTR